MIVYLNAPYEFIDVEFSSEVKTIPKIGESVILYNTKTGKEFKHRVDDVVYNYVHGTIDVYFEN